METKEAKETKEARDVIRITADFTPEAYDTLSEVSKRLGTTKAEALRKALGLLSFVLKHKAEKWRLVLEKGDDRKEVVTL